MKIPNGQVLCETGVRNDQTIMYVVTKNHDGTQFTRWEPQAKNISHTWELNLFDIEYTKAGTAQSLSKLNAKKEFNPNSNNNSNNN